MEPILKKIISSIIYSPPPKSYGHTQNNVNALSNLTMITNSPPSELQIYQDERLQQLNTVRIRLLQMRRGMKQVKILMEPQEIDQVVHDYLSRLDIDSALQIKERWSWWRFLRSGGGVPNGAGGGGGKIANKHYDLHIILKFM
jgi:hypothetical protein